MSRPGRSDGCRATLLLEVMLAVTLLAVVFLGVISGLPALFAAQRSSEQLSLATAAAEQILGEARELDFGRLASTEGRDSQPGMPAELYSLQVVSLHEDLKDVTVTLSWSDRGRARKVVLETVVYGGAGEKGRQ